MQEGFKKSDIEILVSTMNRTNLDFLVPMFPFSHFSDFSIVVINQTTPDRTTESPYPSVRVINSFDKGLSKSRNLALKNLSGKIILLTDDDVVFEKDFESIILKKFNENKNAAAIQFQVTDMYGRSLKKYPKKSASLGIAKILSTMSIELVYNREVVLNSHVKFDENFGLGAAFPLGEEHIFLTDLKKANLPVLYHNKVIVRHPPEKNSDNITQKQRWEIIGAYYVRMFPKTFYFWLVLFFVFTVKHGKVKLSNVPQYFKNAVKGRHHYLNLVNEDNNKGYTDNSAFEN